MSRRLVSVTLDNLSDLPLRCRACVFWELDPVACEQAQKSDDTTIEKEAWISDTLLEWGSCGQILYVDDMAVGYVLYAPAAYVPRAIAFPTSPASPDAILLMTGRVTPDMRSSGLGRMLIQGVARDVARRGIRAVEAFGMTGSQRHVDSDADQRPDLCLLPADYLRAVGFKTVRAHHRTPRLRLDIRSTASWREDMESAFERFLGSIQAPALSRH